MSARKPAVERMPDRRGWKQRGARRKRGTHALGFMNSKGNMDQNKEVRSGYVVSVRGGILTDRQGYKSASFLISASRSEEGVRISMPINRSKLSRSIAIQEFPGTGMVCPCFMPINVSFDCVEFSASADVDVSSVGFGIERHSGHYRGLYLIYEVPVFVKGALQLLGDLRNEDRQCILAHDCQRCGNSSSSLLQDCVGSSSRTPRRYSYGPWPLSLADWIRLIMLAAR